jgi:hypothetical protein
MKKYSRVLVGFFVFLGLSCDDVFEEDISDDYMQIIAPLEGHVVEGNTVDFYWRELDGVDDYRIQVYNESQQILLDSLVPSSRLNLRYILDSGSYQWRIRGENFAYETPYTFPVNFEVVPSEDLSNQTVQLSSPSNGIYTNSVDFIFTWESLENADDYTFHLIKVLNGEQTVYQNDDISETSLIISESNFVDDAQYIWKVKGENEVSETNFSERNLFLDRIAPNQPSLNTPNQSEVIESTVINFNWLNGTDTGNVQSSIENVIEISEDFNFSSLVHSSEVSSNNYQYDVANSGTYYWRVRAIDLAGNQSDYSAVRTFVAQ